MFPSLPPLSPPPELYEQAGLLKEGAGADLFKRLQKDWKQKKDTDV